MSDHDSRKDEVKNNMIFFGCWLYCIDSEKNDDVYAINECPEKYNDRPPSANIDTLKVAYGDIDDD